jgi:2-oxoglutarate dehydrogenase E1 component
VIDMVCYRRRGHSEVDEPSFTQPLMYDTIDKKRSVRKIYTENLIGRGDITVEEAESALKNYQEQLEKVFQGTKEAASAPPMHAERPEPVVDHDLPTAISREVVDRIVAGQVDLPEGFTPHPRLLPQLQKRAKMVEDATIDWALGETLAFGSLLLEGRPVRLAGQDARRGTFGHRHAVIVDRATGGEHTPLANLSPDQAPVLRLRLAAVGVRRDGLRVRLLGRPPDALVLWEAQFGDFVNGAMTIVDEFIAAGEAKWGQRSGVTLLLPHGYEGPGPGPLVRPARALPAAVRRGEHGGGRADTPANYFHLLRRQALQSHKRPLVVMSPKSMLRLRAAASPSRTSPTRASAPCWPTRRPDPRASRRVVLTAGQGALRPARRPPQEPALRRGPGPGRALYPLPGEELADALAAYPNATDVVWCQEEPANQGAWSYIALSLPTTWPVAGRSGGSRARPARPRRPAPAGCTRPEQVALVSAALEG